MYVDIWDNEWNEFQNKVIELALFWVRFMYDNQQAFMIERHVEEIRQNAQKTPPAPWTAKTRHKFRNMPIPLLRQLYRNDDNTVSYFLAHPSIILMNIIHRFQSVDCDDVKRKIEHLLYECHEQLNRCDESISIEYRVKNEETGRFTEFGFTRRDDNTIRRRRYLLKRFKKNNRVKDSYVIKANGYMETYDMDITREEPVISRAPQLPPPRRIEFQPGVYGPTAQEQKDNFEVPVQRLQYKQKIQTINLY